MAIIPKLSTGKVTHVLKLPEFWAVAGALIIAPILAPIVSTWIQKVPFLAAHGTITFVIIGILILLLAASMGGGLLRAIVLGVGASMVLLAVVPIVRQYIGR